jgi:SAM-dependent methyltransferase
MSRQPVDFKRAYDTVAEDYARTFFDELDRKPFDRALLDRYADLMRGKGLVADVGCGPAQIARYLHDRGVEVCGIDLSPETVRVARGLNPFPVDEGDMLALGHPAGCFAGIVSFYAVIHLGRGQVVQALREFRRVLQPGGRLLLAVHGGEGDVYQDEFLGHAVPIQATLFTVAEIAERLLEAGLGVESIQNRPPYAFEHPTERIYLTALTALA